MADSAVKEDGYWFDSGEAPTTASRVVTYAHTPDKLNRSSMNDNGAVTNYSPNALNQYTSATGNSFTYDNNFNLTHSAGFNGVYDAANRLVSASNGGSGEAQTTMAGFVYDGLGRCVKRTFNNVATVFIYDGWKPIGEFDGYGYFQAWNVYGPGADEILLRQRDGIGYTRFHLDRHGNVAFLVDNDGVLQEKYTYDVFGQPKITDATGTVVRSCSYWEHDFLFQGREYIREFGIYDYRNRFYDPKLGRFIQTDPIGLQTEGAKLSAQQKALYVDSGAPEAFSSSELNLYRFCNGDPVNGNDPMGLITYRFLDDVKDWMKRGFTDVINKLKEKSARYRELDAKDKRTVTVTSTDKKHRTGLGFNPKDKDQLNPFLFIDFHDARYMDPMTKDAFDAHPQEMPPSGILGRASVVAHETGHLGDPKGMNDEQRLANEIRNVEINENPIRLQLEVARRPAYFGNPVPLP